MRRSRLLAVRFWLLANHMAVAPKSRKLMAKSQEPISPDLMTQTRQLFGTDGIRGVAGEFPLTRESTYLIGRALGHDLVRITPKARAVIGQDTRESSRWIANRVAEG